MDFSVIKRAGLLQHEFSSLVPVSRVTVNNWVRGHKAPHPYILGRVQTILKVLEAAIEEGDLPLSKGTTNRSGALKIVMKTTVTRLRS